MIEETRHPHTHVDPRYPRDGGQEMTNPPVFAWKPESASAPFVLEVSQDGAFAPPILRVGGLEDPIYLPENAFEPGRFWWRWGDGNDWATTFTFDITGDAVTLEIPAASSWIEAMPNGHPRLYVSEHAVDSFRIRCEQDPPAGLDSLLQSANQLLGEAQTSPEPAFLPDRKLDFAAFWKVWYPTMWGSRQFVKGAEALGLAYLATGDTTFGRAACERMVSISQWDPEGSSYLGHNDEAHMSVIWHGPHACDWVWNLFTDEERRTVIDQYRRRGEITFEHMHDRGLYGIVRFDSHAGREIVFLANLAIVFHDHIPRAKAWLEWLRPVLCGIWPSWSGDDGSWAQGPSYGTAYVTIMTMFATALKRATGVDVYRRPFWKNHIRWRYFCVPPYVEWMGFGDHSEKWQDTWNNNANLVDVIARETASPELAGYVAAFREEARGLNSLEERRMPGVLSQLFTADSLGESSAAVSEKGKVLTVFKNAGYAAIRTNPDNRNRDVAFIFRSSPFGSISHSHANHNDFVLHVGGRVMAMPSGYYDASRTKHHAHWVWHTKSHNCVTLSDASQLIQSHASVGSLVNAFEDEDLAYVCGRADASYPGRAERYRRHVIYAKRSRAIVLIDEFVGPEGIYSSLQWNIHSWNTFATDEDARTFRIERGQSAVTGAFMCHEESFYVTGEGWDPPPLPTKSTNEWHQQYHLRFTPTVIGSERNLGTLLLPQLPGEVTADFERHREDDGREVAVVGKTAFTVYPANHADGPIGLVASDSGTYRIDDDGIQLT